MAGAGMTLLFSVFASLARLAGLGLCALPFQRPRTECHPSLSRCSGRLPSRGCNPIGRPSSSWPTSEKLVWVAIAESEERGERGAVSLHVEQC